jgi:hypothetical protein
VKNNIPLVRSFNESCDLLHLPETKQKYQYLLVFTDLANNACDFEPMKTTNSTECVEAMKKIFLRNFVKKPVASIRTDNGPEFKDDFDKYCWDNNIFHSTIIPDRHKQTANIENLNKSVADILNAYMNKKEETTGKKYREWTDIIDNIRPKINEARSLKLPKPKAALYYPTNILFDPIIKDSNKEPIVAEPKYNIGDMVYVKHEVPFDALGKKQNTPNFRVGDYRLSKIPHRIEKVLLYAPPIPFRYMISDIQNASYTEDELVKSNEDQLKWVVNRIMNKKKQGNKIYYLVKWKNIKGQKKFNDTWEPRAELLKDGLIEYITEYENKQRNI